MRNVLIYDKVKRALNERFDGRGGEHMVDKGDYCLVDLGLPSGRLWMDRNIGADCPEDIGCYFAWGEKCRKEEYSDSNYAFSVQDDASKQSKYHVDGKEHTLCGLEVEDDVVFEYTSGVCRMSTTRDFEELVGHTVMNLEENEDGSFVAKFVSRKYEDVCLTLPLGGFINGRDCLNSENGYYWTLISSDKHRWMAKCIQITDGTSILARSSYAGKLTIQELSRYNGLCVRGVC